jgi:transposase
MEQFIGCYAHKKYSVFVAVNERGEASQKVQVIHDREQYRRYLDQLPPGSQIALEASGHYYWIVDEMESAGHYPRLTHPLEAKKRMGKTGKKTDKIDANGLGVLLRNGTLPEVWIPPAGLRDQRELLHLRMFLVRQRTRLKNRVQGALARYNIQIPGVSDVFGAEGRPAPGRTARRVAATYSAKRGTGVGDDGFHGNANRGGGEAASGTHESHSGG